MKNPRRRALCLALLLAACSTSAPGSGSSGPIKTVVVSQANKKKGVPAPAVPGKNVPAIKVNTVGYELGWKKIAIFNVEPKQAILKDAASGKTVLPIDAKMVTSRGTDAASQDPVWQVDFSAFDKPGKYKLASGSTESDVFEIGKNLYRTAVVAGLKSFYFQRCRTALAEPFATWEGKSYLRKGACHDHDDVGWDLVDHPAKKKKWKNEGGWHDAGNFDMYIPSTAVAAQTLLLAYEWAPALFPDKQANIPESGNGASDLLDEVKFGLIWILSMQEPASGGFRHRDAMIEWSPEGPADHDKTVRWVGHLSSSSTAKAVAVLAQAARLYDKDKAFATRASESAKKGWKWLLEHPEHLRAKRVGGGEQPLWDDEPENNDVGARFAAAAEMWRTFRDADAMKKVKAGMATTEAKDPEKILEGSWVNISRFALWTLASDDKAPADLRADAKKRLVAAAELMHPRVEKTDGYRCASALDDYYWASNSNLMEKLHVLMMAARLDPAQGWALEAARDQWHWILGRNPNGYSMTTRVGKGPDRFYHMEWGPMEPPPPGFLVDGPNAMNAAWLAPGAPAKALLWENPKPLRSGLPPGTLWHWRQSDLWDGGFVEDGQWGDGWWLVVEPDILYSANFVIAGALVGP